MGGRETKLQQTGREKRETPKITTEKNNRTMTMTTGGEVGEATGGQQTTGSFRFLSHTQRRFRDCRQGHRLEFKNSEIAATAGTTRETKRKEGN